VVAKYVLLSNSHDGTQAVRVGFTPIRVVCSNTLRLAHHDKAGKLIRVLHFGNVVTALDQLRAVINTVDGEFEATAQQYRTLARRKINRSDLRKYVRKVLGFDATEEVKPVTQKIIDSIEHLFDFGKGAELPGVKGTVWGAYNAISEHLSYQRGKTQDRRLDSLCSATRPRSTSMRWRSPTRWHAKAARGGQLGLPIRISQENVQMEKKCCRCRETKTEDSFHRSASAKDGRYPVCTVCMKKGAVSRTQPPATRECRRCGVTKPIEKFPRSKHRSDGRGISCKFCKAVHRDKGSARYERVKRKTRERNRRVRMQMKEMLIARLGGRCVDCGLVPGSDWPLHCFDFHHLDGNKKRPSSPRSSRTPGAWPPFSWKRMAASFSVQTAIGAGTLGLPS
jgi:hypothetical protein